MAVCVLGAVLALLLREEKQILAIFVLLALVAVAALPLLELLTELTQFFTKLTALSALPTSVFSPMIKVVGIAAVTKIGCSVCKEAESDTAAALLEMGGTCCALLVALPLVSAVLELLKDLI